MAPIRGILKLWIYLATLALVLMHLVQALTLCPSKIAYCKLGSSRTIEGRMEWERFMVRE